MKCKCRERIFRSVFLRTRCAWKKTRKIEKIMQIPNSNVQVFTMICIARNPHNSQTQKINKSCGKQKLTMKTKQNENTVKWARRYITIAIHNSYICLKIRRRSERQYMIIHILWQPAINRIKRIPLIQMTFIFTIWFLWQFQALMAHDMQNRKWTWICWKLFWNIMHITLTSFLMNR